MPAKKLGRPKTRKKPLVLLSVKVEQELADAIRAAADADSRTVSGWLRVLAERELKKAG